MEETITADFYKGDFDIDEFLNKQTEDHELKDILQFLNDMKNKNSNKMTSVLQEKTDAVISIAEQLQGLYKKIDNLQEPLSQLKEEVHVLAQRVNDVVVVYDGSSNQMKQICKTTANISTIKAYKVILMLTHQLIKVLMKQEEVDFDELERLVSKYAFHIYKMNHLKINDTDSLRPSVDVAIKIILKETFLKAYAATDSDKIGRILDLYVYLDTLDTFKGIVSENIVKPKLESILCEENLKACGNNMELVYGQALSIIENDLKILIAIIKAEHIKVDIILDCFWNVADKLLRTNLITITAAGHPDAFFKHFNDTHKFLKDIGTLYGNPELYRENASFIEHLKRFNLLVYYEIRHQYMSSSFELVILKCSDLVDVQHLQQICRSDHINHKLKIKVSIALAVLVEYVYSDRVFIPMISDQFMKSTLLFTSRYATWVNTCLMPALRYLPKCNEIVSLAICLLNDLEKLKKRVANDFPQLDDAVCSSLRDQLKKEVENDFDTLYKEVSQFLIDYHLEKMKNDLKNVSDIPRLYRKTNRSLPKKCSSYVMDAFKEVDVLYKLPVLQLETKEISFGDQHSVVLKDLLSFAIREYNAMVHTVLNAVSKTEESLRRLKSRNTSSADSNTSQGSSDEGKIRLQIKLDVQQFNENVNFYKVTGLEINLQELLGQIENC